MLARARAPDGEQRDFNEIHFVPPASKPDCTNFSPRAATYFRKSAASPPEVPPRRTVPPRVSAVIMSEENRRADERFSDVTRLH